MNIRHCIQKICDHMVEGRHIGLDPGFKPQFSPGFQNSNRVFAQRARYQYSIPGFGKLAANIQTLWDQPKAGGVDVDAIGFALLHDFGIPGDDLHASLLAGFCNRLDDTVQVRHRKPFLEDKTGCQEGGTCAEHGDIIHGACNSQAPDIATREK